MKYPYLNIIFLAFFLVCLSCSFNGVATADSSEKKFLQIGKSCNEWKKQFDSLSDKDKKSLKKEKVVFTNYGYIISEDLAKDCNLRAEIGHIITKALSENYSEKEMLFAKKYSKEIVDVLRVIWHSENYAHDGAGPDEKFVLLYGRGIDDKEIVPFIGELLEAEGFYPELDMQHLEPHFHWILFNYPKPALDPIVLKRLEIARKKGDILEQVTALIILYKNTPKPTYLFELKKIANSNKILQKAKSALLKIIKKIESKKKLDFEDLDNFHSVYYKNT